MFVSELKKKLNGSVNQKSFKPKQIPQFIILRFCQNDNYRRTIVAFALTDSDIVVAIEALRLHWTKPREKESRGMVGAGFSSQTSAGTHLEYCGSQNQSLSVLAVDKLLTDSVSDS